MTNTNDEPKRGPVSHIIDVPNLNRLFDVLQACCTLNLVFAVQLAKYEGHDQQYPRMRVLIYGQSGEADVQ